MDNQEVGRVPSEDEIDDAVRAWHSGGTGKSLPQYLGWTWDEYVAWVADPERTPQRPLGIAQNTPRDNPESAG